MSDPQPLVQILVQTMLAIGNLEYRHLTVADWERLEDVAVLLKGILKLRADLE